MSTLSKTDKQRMKDRLTVLFRSILKAMQLYRHRQDFAKDVITKALSLQFNSGAHIIWQHRKEDSYAINDHLPVKLATILNTRFNSMLDEIYESQGSLFSMATHEGIILTHIDELVNEIEAHMEELEAESANAEALNQLAVMQRSLKNNLPN
jgi:hypothetical protein